jgi:hypothetical protein
MLHFTMLLAFCLVSLIFSFTRIYGLLELVALALWHPIAVALTLESTICGTLTLPLQLTTVRVCTRFSIFWGIVRRRRLQGMHIWLTIRCGGSAMALVLLLGKLFELNA